jgi:hypothetical protein
MIPSMQPSSQPSAVPSMQPIAGPTMVPSTQPSAQPSGSPTAHPTTSPTTLYPRVDTVVIFSTTASSIVIHVSVSNSGITSGFIYCGVILAGQTPDSRDEIIVQNFYGIKLSNAPTALPTATPTALPTVTPTALPTATPTAIPSFTPTALPSASPSTGVSFGNGLRLSVFDDSSAESRRFNSVELQAAFSRGSSQYRVVINDLLPVQEYAVYCLWQQGMTYAQMLATVAPATTTCCRTLTVSLATSTLVEGSSTVDLLQLELDMYPNAGTQLTVVPVLQLVTTNASGLFYTSISGAVFSPNVFTVVGEASTEVFASESTSVQLSASALALAAGSYRVLIEVLTYESSTVLGQPSKEYEIVYLDNTFSVFPSDEALPAPAFSSAQFSNNGAMLFIAFDADTNLGGTNPNLFKCGVLFAFGCAQTSDCRWTDASTVRVTISSGSGGSSASCVLPGDVVSIATGASIKAECTIVDAAACASWDATSSTVAVSSPEKPLTPVVKLTAPSAVGVCDGITVDSGSSTGDGGRAWASFSVTASSSDAQLDLTALQTFLDSSAYVLSPPTQIPRELLSKNVQYFFNVVLSNFLGGIGESSKTVMVIDERIPSVMIQGPAIVDSFRAESLYLSSLAFIASCNGTISTAGLQFKWATYQNGLQIPSLISSV